MLTWRLISATVIIGGLFGLLFLDYQHPLGAPGVWLLPLALAVSVLMVSEMLDLWRERADRPARWPLYLGAPLVVLSAAAPLLWTMTGRNYPAHCPVGQLGWPLLAMVAGMALTLIGEMARYEKPGRSTGSIALSILVIGYAGLLLSFLVSLRLFYDQYWGMAAIISLIVIVKLSDTGAYFTGRAIGKHKLAPLLSPGKTIEGSLGGIVAAGAGAWICYALVVPALVPNETSRGPLWAWLLYGLLVAIAGIIGDLAESLLKRDMGRKDSSSWLPGLGGVLDILDSIVMAAAPAYFCWIVGLIGPG